MTAIDELLGAAPPAHRATADLAEGRHRRRRRPPRLLGAIGGPLLLAALAVTLRLINLTTSYDLFIDEGFYVDVGQSVAHGHLPYADGGLFFLHPPGHSLLGAAWIRLFDVHGAFFTQIYAMRYLNVFFAAITTVLLYLVGRRVSGPAAGVLAAVVFAISPWFIRQNSFVLLETSAMTFVLLGWLGVLYLPRSRGRRVSALIGIGLLFGFGVLVKEFAVFVTIIPFLVLGWRRWLVGRRAALLVLATTWVPYATWLLVVWGSGNFAEFWRQNTAGFRRASGAQQASGFNSPDAPSFLSTILASASQFWTTYLLMAMGGLAILWLLARGRTVERRALAAFGFGSIPLLAYSVLLGANEEQFYYYLLIPAALVVGVVVRDNWRRARPWLRRAAVVLALVWAASDLTNWAIIHSTPDNGTQQMDEWLAANVPAGTEIGVTNSVQRQVLVRYPLVDIAGPASLTGQDVTYLVVFEKQVTQGYSFISPTVLPAVVGSREPVFSTTGRGNGRIDIFQLR